MKKEDFMQFKKVPSKLVRTLKQGPDFGIHGTWDKNIAGIMDPSNNGFWGHYYGVNENVKKLSDKEFYQRLCASISEGFSRDDYEIVGNEIQFTKYPSIILLTDNASKIQNIQSNPTNTRLSGICDKKGYPLFTFGVGEDAYLGNEKLEIKGVKISPILIREKDVEKINKGLRREIESYGTVGRSQSVAVYLQNQLVKFGLGKIYRSMHDLSKRSNN